MSQISGLGQLLVPLLSAALGSTSQATTTTAAPAQNENLLAALVGGLGGIPTGTTAAAGSSVDRTALLRLLLPLLLSGGGSNNSLGIILLLLVLSKQKPASPTLHDGYKLNLEDAQNLVGTIQGTGSGVTSQQLDAYINTKGADTKEGKIARFLKGVFTLVAFQRGNINRIEKDDLVPFSKVDGRDAKVITATELIGEVVTAKQADAVKKYIANNQDKLNVFGQPKSTVYAAGVQPAFVGEGADKLVALGPNGNAGLFDPVAYFILKNPNWKGLIS